MNRPSPERIADVIKRIFEERYGVELLIETTSGNKTHCFFIDEVALKKLERVKKERKEA